MKTQTKLNSSNCLNGNISGCPYKSLIRMCKPNEKCFHTQIPPFHWFHAVSVKTYRNTWKACLAGSQQQQLLICQSLSRNSRSQFLNENNPSWIATSTSCSAPLWVAVQKGWKASRQREKKNDSTYLSPNWPLRNVKGLVKQTLGNYQ